jgi:pyroglutamyl-peptidase
MKILLTGFNPFGELDANPAQVIVQRIVEGNRLPSSWELVAEILPTEFDAAGQRIRDLIHEVEPKAVLCLGLAVSSDTIRLEHVALNVDCTEAPDNAGDAPTGRRIVPEGPVGYWSTLPVEHMLAALREHGFPATISHHAGTYVCNHVFYTARHEIEQIGSDAWCGFLHVPLMTEQARTEQEQATSMPLNEQVNAVECCLEVLLDWVAEWHKLEK